MNFPGLWIHTDPFHASQCRPHDHHLLQWKVLPLDEPAYPFVKIIGSETRGVACLPSRSTGVASLPFQQYQDTCACRDLNVGEKATSPGV